jgi:addiction module RelE/StbE family toxin
VKVIWTPEAQKDREDIWEFIAKENPLAATRMDELFSEAAARLTEHSMLAKAGHIPGTRELFVHESYRLVYETGGDTVWILTIVHASRQWPPVRGG